MTTKEFERLDGAERLNILRYVADRDGVESKTYVRLARAHQVLLNRANGIPSYRWSK
jgi:hypothetical protein